TDGEIVAANKSATNLTGYSVRELTLRALADLIHPEQRDASRDALSSVASGVTTTLDSTLIHCNGDALDISLLIQPVSRDGRVVSALALAREIHKRAPGAPPVVAREQIYRLLFDHSLEGVLLTSPDGRIYAANASACR